MSEERTSLLARTGIRMADACERYFPDAFLFALAAIIVVFAGGVSIGVRPSTLVAEFGSGFWSLVNFTMQMMIIIVGGFVVASSPPVARLTERLAAIPRNGRTAVAFVALFATLSSLISWGLSLIFTGLLVREICRRIPDVDYRAIGAASYMGLGSVWALGLSSSSALMQATPSAIPPALLPITGVIPLTQTIFLWQSVLMAFVLIVLSVAVAYSSAPAGRDAKTAAEMGITFEPMTIERTESRTPAERLEENPLFTIVIAALMFAYLFQQLRAKGGLAAVDLNNLNFAFIALGLLLHWRPRSFLRAVAKSVPAVAGVLIQFPFYGGIFGMVAKTPISERLADFFVNITTRDTFPVVIALYSALLDMVVPSGGGKWVIEAPYVMAAAKQWGVHPGWTIQVYNASESVTNLLNPFWMLPLMGILNVRARDLAGYAILQFLFQAPVVLFLCWILAYTF
ncbi:MAG TPA: TIGR00366 family protein [Thermoanaerobaculia bacterium]|nr:TIGR00366 family protein [Thermoanaerobaculia bacterium]